MLVSEEGGRRLPILDSDGVTHGSNSHHAHVKYPFQGSESHPSPGSMFCAAVTVLELHDQGGVADRHQTLSVPPATADPVLIDSS